MHLHNAVTFVRQHLGVSDHDIDRLAEKLRDVEPAQLNFDTMQASLLAALLCRIDELEAELMDVKSDLEMANDALDQLDTELLDANTRIDELEAE